MYKLVLLCAVVAACNAQFLGNGFGYSPLYTSFGLGGFGGERSGVAVGPFQADAGRSEGFGGLGFGGLYGNGFYGRGYGNGYGLGLGRGLGGFGGYGAGYGYPAGYSRGYGYGYNNFYGQPYGYGSYGFF